MSKSIEDFLDIENAAEIIDEYEAETGKNIREKYDELNETKKYLKTRQALDEHDLGLEEIRSIALSAWRELMDFAKEQESRFQSSLIQNALSALDTALSAEKLAIEKKLKSLKLDIDRELADFRINGNAGNNSTNNDDSEEGENSVGAASGMKRNDILKLISGGMNDESEKK